MIDGMTTTFISSILTNDILFLIIQTSNSTL